MSDPYASPFPDQYAGQRRSNGQYPEQATQYADPYADQYGQSGGAQYADQYGGSYQEQYPEQYPTQAQPSVQPSAQYPAEHYSSQAYVTPQTPTRRSATRFPETGPIERDRDRDRDSRPAKTHGTPLGRIVMGVFLGMLLWSVVVGIVALVLLASVAGKIENRLDDLNSSVRTTSTHGTSH